MDDAEREVDETRREPEEGEKRKQDRGESLEFDVDGHFGGL